MIPPPKQLQRGVHTMPFRSPDGRQVAVAIDASGRCVDSIMYQPADRRQAYSRLWMSLESQDAEPALQAMS